jgi:hypothetical protein
VTRLQGIVVVEHGSRSVEDEVVGRGLFLLYEGVTEIESILCTLG